MRPHETESLHMVKDTIIQIKQSLKNGKRYLPITDLIEGYYLKYIIRLASRQARLLQVYHSTNPYTHLEPCNLQIPLCPTNPIIHCDNSGSESHIPPALNGQRGEWLVSQMDRPGSKP